MKTLVVLVVAGCCAASVANAGKYFTGNDLYEACKDETERTMQDVQCLAYIQGVAEGSDSTKQALEYVARHPLKGAWCIPATVTVGQERLVVLKHMREHPEELQHSAADVVTFAFAESFPCR